MDAGTKDALLLQIEDLEQCLMRLEELLGWQDDAAIVRELKDLAEMMERTAINLAREANKISALPRPFLA